MLDLQRPRAPLPSPAIDVACEDLASSSTTWTALPDLGETTVSDGNSRRGLDYMHARFRSPLTSRFLSTDPILGTPGSPQSWNRYAYVMGNPLTSTDPDGKAALLAVVGLGALSGGGLEYLAQVGVNMAQGTTGPVHAFDENINGKKILASAALGGVTGGVSAQLKGAGAVVRIGVAAAGNLAEAGAHAAIDGVPLGGQAALTATATGGLFSAGSMLGKGFARGTQAGRAALRELADTAQRLANIAMDGRPRMAQVLRASAAQSLVAEYGGGQINEVVTDSLRKATDNALAQHP